MASRVRPCTNGGEQAGPEPAPAVPWHDVHLLEVDVSILHRGDHHAHEEVILQAAHPDLPHVDETCQVVQRERRVERLVDEPEAGDLARLVLDLDLAQARGVAWDGEANPV